MAGRKPPKIPGPDLIHGATEGVRTGFELARSAAYKTLPSLVFGKQANPEAQGTPVLVVQGFGMHDLTTWTMRRHLDDLGHNSFDPDIGFNLGVRGHIIDRMEERLVRMADQHGQKVSIAGHSLGGIQGLLLSYRHPDKVERLVTMGSPFGVAQLRGGANRLIYGAYEFLNPNDDDLVEELAEYMKDGPPEAAVTSFFSYTDGVVAPKAAVNPWGGKKGHKAENVEVEGSHCGMIVNLDVWTALANRLATPHANWKPFSWEEESGQEIGVTPELVPAK